MNKNIQELRDLFNKHTPNTEMSMDETEIFIHMSSSKCPEFHADLKEINKDSEIYKHFKPVIESFQSQVFLTRIEVLTTFKMTLGALIMFMFHMPTAGAATMMEMYCSSKLRDNTLITLDVLTHQLFSWGFFSEEQLKEIWTAIKESEVAK